MAHSDSKKTNVVCCRSRRYRMLHVDMHTAQRRDPTAPQRQPARRPYFPIAHRPTSLSSTLSTRVKAKDYVQAIKLYKKGLGLLPDKKDPERVNFHKNLALCYIKLENYKDAIKQSSEVRAPPHPVFQTSSRRHSPDLATIAICLRLSLFAPSAPGHPTHGDIPSRIVPDRCVPPCCPSVRPGSYFRRHAHRCANPIVVSHRLGSRRSS